MARSVDTQRMESQRHTGANDLNPVRVNSLAFSNPKYDPNEDETVLLDSTLPPGCFKLTCSTRLCFLM